MSDQTDLPPILDHSIWRTFLELWHDDPPEVLGGLIQEYVRDAQIHIAQIQNGLKKGDADQIEQAAHTLKSSSSNLGARRIESLCRELQNLARARALTDALARLHDLVSCFEQTRKAIEREMDGRSQPPPGQPA